MYYASGLGTSERRIDSCTHLELAVGSTNDAVAGDMPLARTAVGLAPRLPSVRPVGLDVAEVAEVLAAAGVGCVVDAQAELTGLAVGEPVAGFVGHIDLSLGRGDADRPGLERNAVLRQAVQEDSGLGLAEAFTNLDAEGSSVDALPIVAVLAPCNALDGAPGVLREDVAAAGQVAEVGKRSCA